MSELRDQAHDFLRKHGITVSEKWLRYGTKPLWNDKVDRDIYRVTLSRPGKRFSIEFGQSVANTEKNIPPDAYDLLATITKNDPGEYGEFARDYGYELYDPETGRENKHTVKVYKAVLKEWEKVRDFFTDEELTELQEIN